jgi:hypothetical protein
MTIKDKLHDIIKQNYKTKHVYVPDPPEPENPLRYVFVPVYVDELQVTTLEAASEHWPSAKYVIRVDTEIGEAETYIMPEQRLL